MLLGLLADVHEDILRLEESLAIFKTRQVDTIINLGDTVGFGIPYYSYLKTRDANQVIATIKENCSYTVIGNHDLYAIKMLPRNNERFCYPKNWYALDFSTRKRLSNGKLWLYEDNELSSLLDDDNKEFLRTLPEYIIHDTADYKILFSHYSYPDVTGCLTDETRYPSDLKQHFAFMKQNDLLYSFSGHDHYQGIKIFTETSVAEIPLGEKYILPEERVWLHIPPVANGTQKNGIVVFDTETKEIVSIPLNTPTHTYQ
jgi:predicted phosphodiesterase